MWFKYIKGCVQNCREIEIVERWKWVSEIIERWKQVSEIVEKYFPVKSSSQNLREIEFVENMRVSFRNCRELLKQVSEIVEKGGFFSICREQDKTANRMGKKMICLWMAFTAGSIIFQKKEITVLLMMNWNHSYSWRSVFMHLHFHKICIKFCIIRIVQRLFTSKY